MRIVQYLKWLRLEDGGTVRFVIDLAELLSRGGHEVTVLSCDDSAAPDAWKDGGPRSVAVTIRDLVSGAVPRGAADRPTQMLMGADRAKVREIIAAADAVHVHGMWATSNAQVARLARKLGKRTVVTPHGMLDVWSMRQGTFKKRAFLKVVSGPMIRKADAVHFTATAEAEQAAKWLGEHRSIVTPPPVDLSGYETEPDPAEAQRKFGIDPDGPPVVLFLSRVHRKKGVERLLEAAALLVERSVPHQLVVAGPSDPPEYIKGIREQAREFGIEDRIIWPGMVMGPLKRSLYAAADVFVLPTSQENFGYVLIEAMAAGLPVVTTKGVDIWRELEESGGADIVENTAEAVADLLAMRLADRDALRRRGESARAWCFKEMDQAKILAGYEAMYQGRA